LVRTLRVAAGDFDEGDPEPRPAAGGTRTS
jgi:hypothetical protein